MAAVPATFFAGRRLHGTACGLIAALQLAASTVSANHATQLRGYAVSWLPFALMLWCALNINSPQANRWRLGYAVSAVFAVAVLPSNLFFSLIVAAAVSVFHLASGMAWNRRNLIGTAILFGSPCFGMLAYAAIWRDVIAAASVDWSGWNRRILFAQWVISTSAEFTVIPVLAMGGFFVCIIAGTSTQHRTTIHRAVRVVRTGVATRYAQSDRRADPAAISSNPGADSPRMVLPDRNACRNSH